jgi:hypothetical protein
MGAEEKHEGKQPECVWWNRECNKVRGYFTADGRSVSQSVSQSVCLGIEHPSGTCNQILLPVGMLLSEICGLVSVGCPL